MAYVRCGMYDCKNHNKKRGCKLTHVFITEHNKLPCDESGAEDDNNTKCANYERLRI